MPKLTAATEDTSPDWGDYFYNVTDPTGTPASRRHTAHNMLRFRGYIDGLILSNDTDADHDIQVGVGLARDSSNSYMLELTTAITKQIDAAWAAGDDAGGLFSGTVAADTWYHVFLIRKDSDGSIDVGFDTSVTAANIPSGYTAYRRLGSVLTDSSSNILAFRQHGDYFEWDAPVHDVSGGTLATTATALTLTVPTGVSVCPRCNLQVVGSDVHVAVWNPGGTDLDVTTVANRWQQNNTSSGGLGRTHDLPWTNTSAQIEYDGSSAATYNLMTFGWTDLRGKDAA